MSRLYLRPPHPPVLLSQQKYEGPEWACLVSSLDLCISCFSHVQSAISSSVACRDIQRTMACMSYVLWPCHYSYILIFIIFTCILEKWHWQWQSSLDGSLNTDKRKHIKNNCVSFRHHCVSLTKLSRYKSMIYCIHNQSLRDTITYK